MLDMNKHIVKPDDSQPFHTSGYAVVANGDRIGSVSNISFERRQQIDQSRQKVGGYNRSAIGRARSELRARPVADSAFTNRNAINQSAPVMTRSAPIAPPPKYNPFA